MWLTPGGVKLASVAGRRSETPTLITSARIPKSLDADQRNRRYLATMAVRVVCFISGCFAPLPWSIVLILSAAILPGIAVILANAIDQRDLGSSAGPEPDVSRPALTGGVVVPGDVEHPDAPAHGPQEAA